VRNLKSVEKDGKPYSDKMDEVMYEHMRADKNPKIYFQLVELTLKESAKSKDAPYVCEAKGDLAVAGVTNNITMPINILPLGGKKLKISGTTVVKMSQFKVDPPNPLGLFIKTGDDIKIIFDWMVAQRPAAAAAAK
jgi:polyisoprenoid-binding protein YceI